MKRAALLLFAACVVPQPAPAPARATLEPTGTVPVPDPLPVPDPDPDPVPDAAPAVVDLTARPPCTTVAAVRDVDDPGWGPILRDLAQHIEHDGPWIPEELSTSAHESTHLMNTQIMRANGLTIAKQNAFYMLDDCGVILDEPAVRKSDAVAYLPASMHGFRYGQYVTGQESWDDVPTYIFDEWVAYTNGAAAGLELRAMGTWGDKHYDTMAGQVEFTLYAIALAMAVRDLDPTYLTAKPVFAQLLAWNAMRSLDQYRAGGQDEHWQTDETDALYATLRTGADGQAMRDFLTATYGAAYTAALLDL